MSKKRKILILGATIITALLIVGGIIYKLGSGPKFKQTPQPIVVLPSPSPASSPEESPEASRPAVMVARTKVRKLASAATAETQPECDGLFQENSHVVIDNNYTGQWAFAAGKQPTNAPCWKDVYITATRNGFVYSFIATAAPQDPALGGEVRRIYFVAPTPTPTPTPMRFLLTGRVVLANDQPIAGVVVKLLSDPDRQLLSVTTTGADGLYNLYATANTSVILAPQAAGYTFGPSEVSLPDMVSDHYLIFTGSPMATPTPTATPIPTPTPTPTPTPLPYCASGQRPGSPPVCRCKSGYLGNSGKCR